MRLAPTLRLLIASSLLAAPSFAQAPPAGGWVGKRVVTQYGATLTGPRTGEVDDAERS